MDRIETAFNFTSPEDIQFEVDSINISDQPNTSVFLLNFIEGLISQENNDKIMNYIMKLYDESSNTNVIGSNNYFISFNKENVIFNDLIENYQNELNEFLKIKDNINGDKKEEIKMINFEGKEEDIDSEEEAMKIIAKENEEIRRQMEEQEIFFSMRMNGGGNEDLNNFNTFNNNKNNILGLIQEVDNESDDDSEKKSNINDNKFTKSLKSLKKNDDDSKNANELIKSNKKIKMVESDIDSIRQNNNEKNDIKDNNKQNTEEINKEESVEINDNNNIFISNDFQINNIIITKQIDNEIHASSNKANITDNDKKDKTNNVQNDDINESEEKNKKNNFNINSTNYNGAFGLNQNNDNETKNKTLFGNKTMKDEVFKRLYRSKKVEINDGKIIKNNGVK